MNKYLLILLTSLILGSCATLIEPPYTSVDKMLKLEKGMNSANVEKILGVKPYNILHNNDSTSIFEYHYRLKERDVSVNLNNSVDYMHVEESQIGGKERYTKPSVFYLLYKQGEFTTIITDNGLKNADYLLLNNNNLILVTQSDLIKLNLLNNTSVIHKINKLPKSNATFRHSILYSAYIPYGALGLKYIASKKVGGYISGGFSINNANISYLTAGITFRAFKNIDFYFGGGLGSYMGSRTYTYTYMNDWGNLEEGYRTVDYFRPLDSFVIESGTSIYIKRFVIDLGFGRNSHSGIYSKIGFGINF